MALFPVNLSKMLTIALGGPALAFTVVMLWPTLPALAQDGDNPPDSTLGTSRAAPGRMRTGQDDQGNTVMGTAPVAKPQQETPSIGPIWVTPQVTPYGQPPNPVPPYPGPRPPHGQPPVR